jgi:hypothetical protein
MSIRDVFGRDLRQKLTPLLVVELFGICQVAPRHGIILSERIGMEGQLFDAFDFCSIEFNTSVTQLLCNYVKWIAGPIKTLEN